MEFQAPIAIGVSFLNRRINNSIYQLVTPAQNTNGVIIKTFCIAVSVNLSGVIYADASAPTTFNDLTKRQIFNYNSAATSSTTFSQGLLAYPLYVYPGLGVWIATNGDVPITITYDVLGPGGLIQPPVIPTT